jgi:hypothetical protein
MCVCACVSILYFILKIILFFLLVAEAEEKKQRKRKHSNEPKVRKTKPEEKATTSKKAYKKKDDKPDKKAKKEDKKEPKETKPKKKPAKTTPKTTPKDHETEGIVKRNFGGEHPEASVNTTHWEGALGNDYTIKLHTWSTNSNSYVNIRKGKTAGVNVPVQLYWRLLEALAVMRQDNPAQILPKPI